VKVQGNIVSGGVVTIAEGTTVVGDVSGEEIHLAKSASVSGKLLAKNGITFIDASKEQVDEKVKRFEADADVVDDVKEMLE
jgi:predicted acyltransferase (DUF342 family)